MKYCMHCEQDENHVLGGLFKLSDTKFYICGKCMDEAAKITESRSMYGPIHIPVFGINNKKKED